MRRYPLAASDPGHDPARRIHPDRGGDRAHRADRRMGHAQGLCYRRLLGRALPIAVNLSPVQFTHGGLPETVHSILVETGLSPKRLELEVTESLLISDPDMALHTLRRLKTLGVAIAMDDFGTGYSSLSTLQSFPFDKIKIDRSFVDKLDKQRKSASIIRAVLALGRSLEIPVLAEGIETKAHLEFLRNEGCDEAQGYFLGRPMPVGLMFPQAAPVIA